MIPLARGDSGSRKRAKEHEEMVVLWWTLRKALRLLLQISGFGEGPAHDAATSCSFLPRPRRPRLPLLFYTV